MFSPFSKTLSFGSCASLLCSDLLSRPSYAGYCEQRSVRWAFLIYTISKALHSLPLLPGCCNLHFLWPKALSWVIQNIPVKSFASQIAFVILSLSWSAFASLIHWTQATCLSFHFHSHLFHDPSVRTKGSVFTTCTMMSTSNLHVWTNRCSIILYHCLWGESFSNKYHDLNTKQTPFFPLPPSWYFVGCDLICTITSSGRLFWGSHNSV